MLQTFLNAHSQFQYLCCCRPVTNRCRSGPVCRPHIEQQHCLDNSQSFLASQFLYLAGLLGLVTDTQGKKEKEKFLQRKRDKCEETNQLSL